ncbi:MAG: nuclear transport factor 2 family protein [Pseudomonadota bacterium]
MSHRAAGELTALIEAYAAAWRSGETEALKAFWNTSANPVYLAEEADAVFTDWDQVEAYWAANRQQGFDVELNFRDPCFTDMGADLVLAVWRMDWRVGFPDKPAMAGDNRVAALCRRTGDGWRFAAWIEAPLAPITYMRKLYEARA